MLWATRATLLAGEVLNVSNCVWLVRLWSNIKSTDYGGNTNITIDSRQPLTIVSITVICNAYDQVLGQPFCMVPDRSIAQVGELVLPLCRLDIR